MTTRTLPVLPLRDIVVFPHRIVPLFVGREKSVAALEAAMGTDKELFLVAQLDPGEDDPDRDALYDLGVIATALLLIISITGILLNHKRGLGLMPDVPHSATAPFDDALPLADLADRAAAAVSAEVAAAGIDRMDVRPDDGIVKVRFDDDRVIEVTVDIHDGSILHVGERNVIQAFMVAPYCLGS